MTEKSDIDRKRKLGPNVLITSDEKCKTNREPVADS